MVYALTLCFSRGSPGNFSSRTNRQIKTVFKLAADVKMICFLACYTLLRTIICSPLLYGVCIYILGPPNWNPLFSYT